MLLLTFHHIVFDGWSDGIFFGELSKLYAAYAQGKGTPLEDVPIQYGDYAEWQRAWLQGEVLETQLSYWKEKLAGDLPVLDLPADRARPGQRTNRGITETFELPESVCRKLEELSQRESATMFMTLLSAFEVLMLRYSGQEELLVGTPVAGRNRKEIERLVGFFVNTLVLRTDLGGNPTFYELLGRVRKVCLEAFEHQDVPFEKLVEELHPQRSVSHSPLFQAVFALQGAQEATIALGDCIAHRIDVNTETAKFDVMLSLTERNRRLAGSLQCDADLFDRDSVQRMIVHFTTLLEGIAVAPGEHVWQLPIMAEDEVQKVTVEWNRTQTEYPSVSSIQGLFEAQVRQAPDAVAVVFGDRELTYRELNERANRLAHFLLGRGVGREAIVGVAMERSPDMIVALLGTLKAGGAYLPLDPAYPPERLAFMLDDAGATFLLTQERMISRFGDQRVASVCSERDWGVISRENEGNPPATGSGESLAYVMYTSGSTGLPKGVGVLHRGVVRLVRSTDYADLNAGEVLLQFSPISFDASTFEIWGSLLNGARLVVFPPYIPSPAELGSTIREKGVTTLWLTSALFNQMVDGPPDALGGLRQLLAGGDVLSVPHVKRFILRHPECRLINGYGPTENTTFTCCYTVTSPVRFVSFIPIGKPIRNTRVYILDRYRQPVPVGIPGEIYIGGAGLARGYVRRPELTAQKFVPDPFRPGPEERLYSTGDYARYLPDGNIEFLGRIDGQVKIRGFRIELGEIEAVLAQHPAVRELAVVVQEGPADEKRLVAYCVVNQESRNPDGELRRYLKSKLPEHMVPSDFVFLDALPLTPSGKIDRRSLRRPGPDSPVQTPVGTGQEASPAESAIAGILAQVLGLEHVGLKDNFFELGGHSLLAMKVMSRIRDAWQVDLPLVCIFENPTAEGLAVKLEGKLVEEIKNITDDSASHRTV